MRPLQLRPILVEKPWGGRRLAELGRKLPEHVPVGESWDVADLTAEQTSQPDPVTRVVGGDHEGAALHELVATHRDELLGESQPTTDGRFPLLVKHLDAAQHLSVQVHPPAELVVDGSPWAHKTETWVVVRADPGAVIFLGFRDGTSLDRAEASIGTSAIVDLLQRVPARVGDVHHLPAGLVHALGAGVVVAEVQTPSDTTFRLYDWTEEYARADRDLHLEAGRASLRAGWQHNLDRETTPSTAQVHVDAGHYLLTRGRADEEQVLRGAESSRARVLLVLEGRVHGRGIPGSLGPGDVRVLPASWSGELTAVTGTTWLTVG